MQDTPATTKRYLATRFC